MTFLTRKKGVANNLLSSFAFVKMIYYILVISALESNDSKNDLCTLFRLYFYTPWKGLQVYYCIFYQKLYVVVFSFMCTKVRKLLFTAATIGRL